MNKWIRRGLFLILVIAVTVAGIFTPRALLGRQEAALLGVSGTADGKTLRPYLDMKSNATRIALLYDLVWNGTTTYREPLDTELSAGTAIELAKRYLGALMEEIRSDIKDTWEWTFQAGQARVTLLSANEAPTMSAWIVDFGEVSLGLDAVSGVPVMIFGTFIADEISWKETAWEGGDISDAVSVEKLWQAITAFYGKLDGELFSFPETPKEIGVDGQWQVYWHGNNVSYPIRLNGYLSRAGERTVMLSVWLGAISAATEASD